MLPRSCSRISLRRCGISCCLLVLLLMMLNLTVRADQAPPQNAPPPQNAQQPQNARQAEYVVGPNDVLGITVYRSAAALANLYRPGRRHVDVSAASGV